MLTTCRVTSPEELKQLTLCRRGWCVRTPFALCLKSEVLGISSPYVWDTQMLWCPNVAFKVTALLPSLPSLGDWHMAVPVSTDTLVRGIVWF